MSDPTPATPLTIEYCFRFADNTQKNFCIELDNKSLALIKPPPAAPPAWTALSCHQCPHCPLTEQTSPHCPIAVNLVEMIDFFCQSLSFESIDLFIKTNERNYSKENTNLQTAISSLIGIYMVTSGCPIMDKLRPMVRFHLPFASMEETTYRAISMYLMAQWVRTKERKRADWALTQLHKLYEDINAVNMAFAQRLKELQMEDASINALIRLSCFAQNIHFSLTEDMLDDIKPLFAAYL